MYLKLLDKFFAHFYDTEVKLGHCSGFDRCEEIAMEMFAEWLDKNMDTLKYLKKLAKETNIWYKEIDVDGINVMPPTREEWAIHFDVSPKLWEHVLLETDNQIKA
jgi:hypothetical protein